MSLLYRNAIIIHLDGDGIIPLSRPTQLPSLGTIIEIKPWNGGSWLKICVRCRHDGWGQLWTDATHTGGDIRANKETAENRSITGWWNDRPPDLSVIRSKVHQPVTSFQYAVQGVAAEKSKPNRIGWVARNANAIRDDTLFPNYHPKEISILRRGHKVRSQSRLSSSSQRFPHFHDDRRVTKRSLAKFFLYHLCNLCRIFLPSSNAWLRITKPTNFHSNTIPVRINGSGRHGNRNNICSPSHQSRPRLVARRSIIGITRGIKIGWRS